MGRKKPITPNSRIKAALRQLSLRSRERAAAIKAAHNSCQKCNRKFSAAKGREVKSEVHHKEGVLNWQEIYDVVRKNLLCSPDKMEVLCKDCHGKETDKQRTKEV